MRISGVLEWPQVSLNDSLVFSDEVLTDLMHKFDIHNLCAVTNIL
jgi:hypothetical protein